MRRAFPLALILLLLPGVVWATVTSQTALNLYTGNAAQTVFPYTFRILSNADIAVTVGGVPKVLTTDFTVSNVGAQNGGNVTFLSPPANGAPITFSRSIPITQTTDYVENAPFSAETLERNLDKLTMIAQRLATDQVRAPANTPGLVVPSPGASQCLAWNAAGTQLEVRSCGNINISGAAAPNLITPQTFGAVGNGVANDTAAITSANAVRGVYTPQSTYLTTLTPSQLAGPYWGAGAIKDSGGKLRGRWFSHLSAAPSSRAAFNITDWYSGDTSRVQIPVEHRISGANTLGSVVPAGYDWVDEAAALVGILVNDSGQMHATTAVQRTAVPFADIHVTQRGKGDVVGLTIRGFQDALATNPNASVLNGPNTILMNGGVTTGVAGAILNVSEFQVHDNGFDVAGTGHIVQLIRNVDTGAKGAYWLGFRVSSGNNKAADAMFSGAGRSRIGLDLTGLDTESAGTWTRSAVTMRADDRIYLNATYNPVNFYAATTGDDFISYQAGTGVIAITKDGNPTLQVGAAQITVAGVMEATGGVLATGVTFAALGAPANGIMKYCTDCTFANPCAGAGTGAIAKRLNGAWRCD